MGRVDRWATDELRKGGALAHRGSAELTGDEMLEVLKARYAARARSYVAITQGTISPEEAPYDSILSLGNPGAPRTKLTPDQYATRMADEAVEDLAWASEAHIKSMRSLGGVPNYRMWVYGQMKTAIDALLVPPGA